MKKTGELLKAAREEKGLSLHEIAMALKINTKVLKAIEEANPENLPAKTFLRGFVKSYASYLKLDVEHVLAVFSDEMGTTKPSAGNGASVYNVIKIEQPTPLAQQAKVIEEPYKIKHGEKVSVGSDDPDIIPLSQPSNKKMFFFLALSVALISLIIVTKKTIDRYTKEATVESVEVVEPLTESTTSETTTDSADVAGAIAEGTLTTGTPDVSVPPGLQTVIATPPGTTATTTPPAVAPEAPANKIPVAPTTAQTTTTAPATTVTAPVAPTAPVVPVKTPTPPTVSAQNPAPNTSAAVKPATPPSTATTTTAPANASVTQPTTPVPAPTQQAAAPQKGKPVELIIEALGPVEIEYSSASGKVNKIRLDADQIHTFKSRDGLSVKISNGGSVNLIHNGKDLGVPGESGKPIKLNY
ncbi:MAG: helix-turn-helix domain-containing protein [Bdellovibrionia bacterium]